MKVFLMRVVFDEFSFDESRLKDFSYTPELHIAFCHIFVPF